MELRKILGWILIIVGIAVGLFKAIGAGLLLAVIGAVCVSPALMDRIAERRSGAQRNENQSSGEMKIRISIAVILTVLAVTGIYGGYRFGFRQGYSDGIKADAAQYQNDWNADVAIEQHSSPYRLGYSRGMLSGQYAERDKCSGELAQLAVEAGNTKVTAKYLVESYFGPQQLEEAIGRSEMNVRREGR
jgi:hypothetical protein